MVAIHLKHSRHTVNRKLSMQTNKRCIIFHILGLQLYRTKYTKGCSILERSWHDVTASCTADRTSTDDVRSLVMCLKTNISKESPKFQKQLVLNIFGIYGLKSSFRWTKLTIPINFLFTNALMLKLLPPSLDHVGHNVSILFGTASFCANQSYLVKFNILLSLVYVLIITSLYAGPMTLCVNMLVVSFSCFIQSLMAF